MKSNKNTFLNRFLWRRNCKKKVRQFTRIKLNDFYLDLLKNGHKAKFPQWKVQIAINCCIDELSSRDKSNKSKMRVCGSSK